MKKGPLCIIGTHIDRHQMAPDGTRWHQMAPDGISWCSYVSPLSVVLVLSSDGWEEGVLGLNCLHPNLDA